MKHLIGVLFALMLPAMLTLTAIYPAKSLFIFLTVIGLILFALAMYSLYDIGVSIYEIYERYKEEQKERNRWK